MALHPCPRCKALIPVGVSYCDTCKPIADAQAKEAREHRQAYKRAQYNKDYNKRRNMENPKYRTFRNSKAWRILSRTKLQDCGYRCEARLDGCTRLAVEVHHIKPIKTPEGWEARLEWDNLMGVCIGCHNILDGKTFKRRTEPGVIDLKTIK